MDLKSADTLMTVPFQTRKKLSLELDKSFKFYLLLKLKNKFKLSIKGYSLATEELSLVA
jgi:hypothetical protein